MSLLISKAVEKYGVVLTINGQGVFIQEMRLGSRPMSQRVKIGQLAMVIDLVEVDYKEWNEYDALLIERNILEKQVKASKAIADKEKKADQISACEELEKKLFDIEALIFAHPVRSLDTLNGVSASKIVEQFDKLLDKVRSRNKLDVAKMRFTHHPTKEYFLQKQCEELLKRHNDELEVSGSESGYLTYDEAYKLISNRFKASASKLADATKVLQKAKK